MKTTEELRQEFSSPKFREYMKEELGSICMHCKTDTNIEYHHYIPITHGGTNDIKNLVVLCEKCHKLAHKKIHKKYTVKTGRPKAIDIDSTIFANVHKRWVDLEIGTKEAMSLLNIKHTSQWHKYKKEYEGKNNIIIKNNHNTIDVKMSKHIRDNKEYYKQLEKEKTYRNNIYMKGLESRVNDILLRKEIKEKTEIYKEYFLDKINNENLKLKEENEKLKNFIKCIGTAENEI